MDTIEQRLARLERDNERLHAANERLAAVNEIQNVMALHEFYHAAHTRHGEELRDIWVQKTPGVSLEIPEGRFEGMALIKALYVDAFAERGKYQLQEMRKQFPQIEDKPENNWIGAYIMHALTTPLIEVAGDGETAKAIWISPGTASIASEGKNRSLWYYDRYGVDFAKEDGKWKIWHMLIAKDFVTPFERSWVEQAIDPAVTFGNPDLPPGPKPNAVLRHPYKPYSPFDLPRTAPRLPEPYRTFSETFSY